MLAIWSGFLVLVGLIWLSRHAQVSRGGRRQTVLHPGLYTHPAERLPRVSVLVAAKDEQDNIGRCVGTMLAQDHPDFEMIVINDRSVDRTAQIVDELAGGDACLKVLHIKELREGWFGKNNAMREGVEQADGDWLCFSDADCRYTSPRLLTVAMRHALAEGVDFLSVLPVLETHGVWERIIQPACGAVLIFWFRPERVNSPHSTDAYANGAFMLIRRDAYEQIGGHEPVKAEVNEDVHMARVAKQHGLRLAVVQNRGLYQTRMYTTFGQMWRGWSRIFYGCFGTPVRLVWSLLFLLLFSLSPWLSSLAGWVAVAARGFDHAGAWLGVAIAGTAAAVVQWTVMLRFYHLSQAGRRYAVSYPLGALICFGMVLEAMRKLLGARTTWRGTTYRGKQVV